jgi:hypothetical protein
MQMYEQIGRSFFSYGLLFDFANLEEVCKSELN